MQPLWNHQKQIIEKAKGKSFGIFAKAGTGKTRTLLEILQNIYATEGQLKTIIFCPGIVVENWAREFNKFTYIKSYELVPLHGTGKQRLSTFNMSKDSVSIFITNYESALMQPLFDAFLKWQPDICVADEAHLIKSPSAQRTKKLLKLSKNSKYRYALTGTPILNSLTDLFSQFLFIDQGETFGKNFFGFRACYFYDKNAYMPQAIHFPDWVVKPTAEEEVKRKIAVNAMVVKKEECLDLPPLVKQTIFVEMSGEQKRMYNEMKKDFIAYYESKACIAEFAMTKAMRLMQISSGIFKADDGTEISLAKTPKLEALAEILPELTKHSKVIIWACFSQNYKQIRELCEGYKIPYVQYHGEVGHADKRSAVDTFNNSPECRVYIGHPRSGGIGVNLVSASYSIVFSRTHNLGDDLQSEARNYRAGSEIHEKITKIDLVCKDTIDEIILENLAKKKLMSDTVLGEIVKQLKEGK